jgi:hypothetical protein
VSRRDLRFKPYKKCKLDGLSEVEKGERVKRAKALLKRHHADGVKKIAFSDEKLCMTEQKLNALHDRVYALPGEHIPVDTFQLWFGEPSAGMANFH